MPRTLSGLQTGEFDEIDVLHSVKINMSPGEAGQVLTSDGYYTNWNDIPSELPSSTSGQILSVDTNDNPSFVERSDLVTGHLSVNNDNKIELNSTINGLNYVGAGTLVSTGNVAATNLLATGSIGGVTAQSKAELTHISDIDCENVTATGSISGTIGGSNISDNSISSTKLQSIPGSKIDDDSISATKLQGAIDNSKLSTSTISGIHLGNNLNTLSHEGGAWTYNGNSAITVPSDKTLTIQKDGTDVGTYDPEGSSNTTINITTSTPTHNTLTITHGSSSVNYDTTSNQTVSIPNVQTGVTGNIQVSQTSNTLIISLNINGDLNTNGNDINLTGGYGGTNGNIKNVKDIGESSNLADNVYGVNCRCQNVSDISTMHVLTSGTNAFPISDTYLPTGQVYVDDGYLRVYNYGSSGT